MSIIIGIDHGYYAIKTAHCSFPAGLTSYGEHEPYTRQGLLEFGGCFFVRGSGRQPIQRDKTINDNYYLLTLAAIDGSARIYGEISGNVVCHGNAVVLPGTKLDNRTQDCFVLEDDRVSVQTASRTPPPKEPRSNDFER